MKESMDAAYRRIQPVMLGEAKPPILGQGWGPKGQSLRPKKLIAGVGFLGTGKLAFSSLAIGSEERFKHHQRATGCIPGR